MQYQVSLLLAEHEMQTILCSSQIVFFASDFRSFAGAPISLDVLLHVLEVVLQLLDPVRSSCGSDRQLVPVVPDVNQGHIQGQSEESSGNTKKQPVNSISQVSCVRSFLFLLFSVPQTSLL